MELHHMNPKPAVLRCSRCGRFVNWTDARLQVIDGCRPHIELPPVLVREERPEDRPAVLDLFRRDFGHTNILTLGAEVVLDEADAIVAEMKGEIAGALAYRVADKALQMLALATNPMWQRSGVGGHLLAEAERLARRRNANRVMLATTNDNLPACPLSTPRISHDRAVLGARLARMGEGGMPGFGGIPVVDEIRLEKPLAVAHQE